MRCGRDGRWAATGATSLASALAVAVLGVSCLSPGAATVTRPAVPRAPALAGVIVAATPVAPPLPPAAPDPLPRDGVDDAFHPLPLPAAWWHDASLQQVVDATLATWPPAAGRVAVSVRHLGSGASAAAGEDAVMAPASLFKLGVLVEAMRRIDAGDLRLDDRLLLTEDDWAEGAGILQGHLGERVTVDDLLHLMIGISDNTAALALMRRLGIDAVNAAFVREGLVRTHYYPDWRPDTTTAAEMATLLARVAGGLAAGPAATRQMLDLLSQRQPQAWIQDALPHEAIIAHKSGQLPGVRNDAALVFRPDGPYVLVVLTDGLLDDADGEQVIGEVAAAVDGYFAFSAHLGAPMLASSPQPVP